MTKKRAGHFCPAHRRAHPQMLCAAPFRCRRRGTSNPPGNEWECYFVRAISTVIWFFTPVTP